MPSLNRVRTCCPSCEEDLILNGPCPDRVLCPRCGHVFSTRTTISLPVYVPWLIVGAGLLALLLVLLVMAVLAATPRAPVPAPQPVAGLADQAPPDEPVPADAPRPVDAPPTDPLPVDLRTHRLIVQAVEVAYKKANDDWWDFGLGDAVKPDPFVRVHRTDEAHEKYVAHRAPWLNYLAGREARERHLADLRVQRDRVAPVDPQRARLDETIKQLTTQYGPPMTPVEREQLETLRKEVAQAKKCYDHRTAFETNAYKARFEEDAISVSPGDRVTIDVWDKDVTFDDRVGQHRLTITEEHLRQGKIVLEFDQVVALELRFTKR